MVSFSQDVDLSYTRHRTEPGTLDPLASFNYVSSAALAEKSSLQQSDPRPDPKPEQVPEPEHNGDGQISDQEWEIRTGRAIDLLRRTLPDFFYAGLVTSLETSLVGRPQSSEHTENGNGHAKADLESIYSKNIRLWYTPPDPLPPPFPRTLTIEGSALYLASSAFVRHTLNALYTDLRVHITRVRVHGHRSPEGSTPATPGAGMPPPQKHRGFREKSLFLGLSVSGVLRVSGAKGGWEVNSTYTFSPLTGLIHQHQIDSIEPAPHQAVFDALRAALAKLGLAGGPQAHGVPGTARAVPELVRVKS